MRKGYRPYRNRAIIYTLIETGMRRAAITKLGLQPQVPVNVTCAIMVFIAHPWLCNINEGITLKVV